MKWTQKHVVLQGPQWFHSRCFAFEYWCKTPALGCVQRCNLRKHIACSFLTFTMYLYFDCCSYSQSSSFVSSQLEQLYSLSLCSKEDCVRVLSRYQWNLQEASRYLIRWSREGTAERERPPANAERRVWRNILADFLTFFYSNILLHINTLDTGRYNTLWCVKENEEWRCTKGERFWNTGMCLTDSIQHTRFYFCK